MCYSIQKITFNYHKDERGVFQKIFDTQTPVLANFMAKQVNYVTTANANTLRGLHYQVGEYAEAKLFRIINGAMQLGAFNYSKGESYTTVLKDPKEGIFIPRGYATGYLVLEANTTVLYLSDNDYHPDSEKGIRWNDPQLDIDWKTEKPILSEKDKKWENFYEKS